MNPIPPNIERDIELANWARDKAIPALEKYKTQSCSIMNLDMAAKEALEALPEKE